MIMQIQPAVKKETGRIAAGCAAGCVLMILGFALLHRVMPDSVPFDYKVILGGCLGSAVAVLNFFLMGVTVQKIASMTDQDQAFKSMKASYRSRTLIQLFWVVLALILPVINGAAGIIPLFFPSLSIKILVMLGMIKTNTI